MSTKTQELNPVERDGEEAVAQAFVVRLPGFVSDEQIGLGDALKRVTAHMGIQTCGGCTRRVAALNRWVVFAGRRPD